MQHFILVVQQTCVVVVVDRNYIPEKRKFSGIFCFCQQRSRRRRRVTISLSAR